MPVRLLSDETINRIAAGEVIERPASVVRELLDNAIDAGASSLSISCDGTGTRRIRVSDNGSGMDREDLALSVTRHATSKIQSIDDLGSLHTLGFRGEALASIAAVSRLTLSSRPSAAPAGWEIRLDGGKLHHSGAWGGAPGTSVEVADLFYNTPARRKFLKSDATERSRIIRALEESALAWPECAFSVTVDDRKVISAPRTETMRQRLADILGDQAAAMLEHETMHPHARVRVHVLPPERSLASRTMQFLIINRRPVSPSRSLLHALYEGFHDRIPPGRHPGAVIFIDIDPAEIDVNIHPAKREIKFAHEQEIHHLVSQSVAAALSGYTSRLELPARPAATGDHSGPARSGAPYRSSAVSQKQNYACESQAAISLFAPPDPLASSTGPGDGITILGQFDRLYLIASRNNELFIIDQHAAAERIRYERYMHAWDIRSIPEQQLLVPLTVDLPASTAALVRENLSLLRAAGWAVDEFGAASFRLSSVPSFLGGALDARHALDTVIDALEKERTLPDSRRADLIIRAACHASIQAGDMLSLEEQRRLVADLLACEAPFSCPHGRPTILVLTSGQLEHHFHRK